MHERRSCYPHKNAEPFCETKKIIAAFIIKCADEISKGREVLQHASYLPAEKKAALEGSRFPPAYEDQERQERARTQKA